MVKLKGELLWVQHPLFHIYPPLSLSTSLTLSLLSLFIFPSFIPPNISSYIYTFLFVTLSLFPSLPSFPYYSLSLSPILSFSISPSYYTIITHLGLNAHLLEVSMMKHHLFYEFGIVLMQAMPKSTRLWVLH